MIRIMGVYRGRTEEIDTADTHKEARILLNEYRMAFGVGWSLWVEPPEPDKESPE